MSANELDKAHENSDESLAKYRKMIHGLLVSNGNNFTHVVKEFPEYADDEESVLLAAKTMSTIMFHVSDRLKDKEDFVYKIICINSINFDKISSRLRNDTDFIYKVLKTVPHVYNSLDKKFQDDPKIAIHALNHGLGMTTISDELRDREDIIKVSLSKGSNFAYASERLQDDIQLANLALDYSPSNFIHFSSRLKLDPTLMRKVVEKDHVLFGKIDENISNYAELLGIYVKKCQDYPSSFLRSKFNDTRYEKYVVNALSENTPNYSKFALIQENAYQSTVKTNVSDLSLEWLLKATPKEELNNFLTEGQDFSLNYAVPKNAFLKEQIALEIHKRDIYELHHPVIKDKEVKGRKRKGFSSP